MKARRFITADVASNVLYWDCPKKCTQLHTLTVPAKLPAIISCSCGHSYVVKQVNDLTSRWARILIEGESE